MERHLAVINPISGKNHGRIVGESLSGIWEKRGWLVDVVFTRGIGDAANLVKTRGTDYATIIAGGGDGTVHEVIQGLDLARHRLAVIPIGTGNDFAWLNGWDPDPKACADRMAENRDVRLDLGSFEHIRFHNSVGFGFEAAVNHQSHKIRRIKGAIRYVVALLQTLPKARTWQTVLTGDHEEWQGAMFSGAFLIGKRVGGVFMLCPHADNTDGKLDLMIAERLGPVAFTKTVADLFAGRDLTAKGISTSSSKSYKAEFDREVPVYVDGETVGRRRVLEVNCLPGALKTY